MEPQVLIIGAGITGLLIAQSLKQHNVNYTIFEAEVVDAFRPREWTMGIHWSVPLLEKLLPTSLMCRIREACVDKTLDYAMSPANGSRIYDGVSGEVLKELVTDGTLLRVSRRNMRQLCSEGIEVKVRLPQSLVLSVFAHERLAWSHS